MYNGTETRRHLLACLFKDESFISIFTIYKNFKKGQGFRYVYFISKVSCEIQNMK